jgi:hypothetical protein
MRTVLRILAGVTMTSGLAALWIGARRKGTAPPGQPGRITSAMLRYIGVLPPNPTRLARLRWVRRFCLRVAGPWIPVLIVMPFYIDATWAYVAIGVILLLWAEGLIGISLDIHRERLKDGGDAS